MTRRFTAAVVQHPPVILDREATLDRLESLTQEAAREGARLVVFSESFIPGYPTWIFGIPGWEDPRGKRLYRRLVENSLEIPSPELTRMQELAAKHQILLVVGVTERDARFSRTSLFNSLVFIDQDGALLGVHRKIMPTSSERVIWSYGDASGMRSYDTGLGRIGGLICYEHWMPLPRFALHASGEEIHIAAWPDVTEIEHLASRHYAFEGRAFVLCVGQYVGRSDLGGDEELGRAFLDGAPEFDRGDEVVLPAGSGIIGPDGGWIAGPAADGPAIVYGEIDLDQLVEEKEVLDTGGHYFRPDIFSVEVDRSPRPIIRFSDDEPDGVGDTGPADIPPQKSEGGMA